MIDLFKVRMDPAAHERVAAVLASGYIGQGPVCAEFERAFGELVGAPEPPLLLNSCTSAIDLALHLIGVGPGDEVVSTPITCTATNSPVVTRGARLVWADVDPLTGNIDPRDVVGKVTGATKAIIAVNWGGRACDYSGLSRWDIPIIEDAAHGPYRAGGGGDYQCFSFQAIKQLTLGDGGALLSHEGDMARAKLLRWYGLDRESSADFRCAQNITEVGYKYQSNDIAAAIGLANLPGMAAAVDRCRANAAWYCDWLADLPGVTVPPYDPGCSYWLMTLLVEDRADFMAYLGERGIATSQVHRRNDAHTAFRAASATPYPLLGVRHFNDHQVSIPSGWWVTDAEREYIARHISEWALVRARRAA